jgi:hypothetical protein
VVVSVPPQRAMMHVNRMTVTPAWCAAMAAAIWQSLMACGLAGPAGSAPKAVHLVRGLCLSPRRVGAVRVIAKAILDMI